MTVKNVAINQDSSAKYTEMGVVVSVRTVHPDAPAETCPRKKYLHVKEWVAAFHPPFTENKTSSMF